MTIYEIVNFLFSKKYNNEDAPRIVKFSEKLKIRNDDLRDRRFAFFKKI